MKVAFVFDTFLLKKDNDYYAMTLTYDFFKKRYLTMFDNLVVITRFKDIVCESGNVNGYMISNGENVDVSPIVNYNDIPDSLRNRKKIMNEMMDKLKNVDKIIIRMPSILGCFACSCAEKLGKPYIIEMVACPWDNYMNHARIGGKLIAPIMTMLTKKYVKRASNVLYVTNEFLQKRYPTTGNSIACSDVVLNENNDNYLKERLDKINNYKSVKVLKIVTVASVQLKYKGQEYVIKALRQLIDEGYIVKYYLIGGGDNSRLKAIVKKYDLEKYVIFVGSIPHNKILENLVDMDLYIQPSLQEGLPRALIEAMSIGMPAIGSTAGGIPELLDEEMIFKKKDTKSIFTLISSMTKEKMLEQAQKNYYTSTKYRNSELELIRKKFYEGN